MFSQVNNKMSSVVAVALLCVQLAAGAASNFTLISPVNMRSAGSFGVLAGSTVTNNGYTVVDGDLGLYPGSSVVGAPSVVGVTYIADTYAMLAKGDLTTASLDAAARPMTAGIAGDLGGLTLRSGVYKADTGIGMTNILYLDAQHNPDAVWIFQIGTLLTVNAYSQVIMINPAPYPNTTTNVWWNCGSSATIATGATIIGTIMASQSISVAVGASTGPLLASVGGVTLQMDAVHAYQAPSAIPSAAPTLSPNSLLTASLNSDSATSSSNANVSQGAVAGLVLMGFFVGFVMAALCCFMNRANDMNNTTYQKTEGHNQSHQELVLPTAATDNHV